VRLSNGAYFSVRRQIRRAVSNKFDAVIGWLYFGFLGTLPVFLFTIWFGLLVSFLAIICWWWFVFRRIWHQMQPRRRSKTKARQVNENCTPRVLVASLTTASAANNKTNTKRMKRKTESRDELITPGQIRMLNRLIKDQGIPAGTTKDQASKLISRLLAEKVTGKIA
jgi:hypothetical protein